MKKSTFLFWIIIGICNNLFSQEKNVDVESVEIWKNQVLTFVHENLDSLYKLTSDDLRIRLLENYEDFIVKNDNKNYYRIGPNFIFSGSWFEEYGYLMLFPEIIRFDSISESFNGFKFFYRTKFMYNTMCESSEVISEELGKMAYRNPKKFLQFIESTNEITEVKRISSTPFWTKNGMDDFKKSIEKSIYYKEIVSVLLN